MSNVPRHAFLTFDGCKTFHLGITNSTGTWITGCRIICTERKPDGVHWREPGRSECCPVCSNIYSQKKSWFRKMLAHGQPLLKFKKTHGKNKKNDTSGSDYVTGGL